jgi:rubrerythrin
MEEQGKIFYDTVSTYAEDQKTKKLFDYLKDQEEEHAKTFLKFCNLYSKKKSSFSLDEHSEGVLDTLLRGLLLPDISEVRDTLAKKKSEGILSIIKIAMDVELNTIIFYQKLKEAIGEKETGEALHKIIKEEESHLVKLKNLRANLDPFYAGIEYGRFF